MALPPKADLASRTPCIRTNTIGGLPAKHRRSQAPSLPRQKARRGRKGTLSSPLHCHAPAMGALYCDEPGSLHGAAFCTVAGASSAVARHAYMGAGSTATAMASNAADHVPSTSSNFLSKPNIPSWGSCPPDFVRSAPSGGGAGISLMGFPSR